MKNLGQLLNNIVVRKSYGYKFHTFRTKTNRPFKIDSKLVDKKDICIANNLLNNMVLKTEEDYILALSCLSVLGAGAKRLKENENFNPNNIYALRRHHLYNIIATAIQNNIDIKFANSMDQKTKEPITYVEIASLQFGFHIDTTLIASFCKENGIDMVVESDWNRKFAMQNGAKEIFEFTLYLKNTSETLTGERPKDYVDFLNKYYYLDENKVQEDFNITLTKISQEDFLKIVRYEFERGL